DTLAVYEPGRSEIDADPLPPVRTCRPPSEIAAPDTGSPASRTEIVTLPRATEACAAKRARTCVCQKPLPSSANRSRAPDEPSHPFCGTEAGGTPSAALRRQAVPGWPSLVSVAPITLEASATAPPQTALWGLQLLPAAGAVKVWMPAVPAANSRSVPSGIVSRARPPLPFQPVATVDVPDGLPAEENRVSKIDVDVAPRFQITCRT